MLSEGSHILGDTGAAGWDDRMFNVKVYCKIETSPWHLLLPNQFAKRTSERPEKKNFWPISEEKKPGDSGVFLHDICFLIDCHC